MIPATQYSGLRGSCHAFQRTWNGFNDYQSILQGKGPYCPLNILTQRRRYFYAQTPHGHNPGVRTHRILGACTSDEGYGSTGDTSPAQLLPMPVIDTSDGLRIDGELVADKGLYETAKNDRVKLYSGIGKEAEDLTDARFLAETGIWATLRGSGPTPSPNAPNPSSALASSGPESSA
ncbi:hypothetical protein SAMN05660916_02404 [Arthrobacter sp. 31Cvi3.1E]|nr:hypothetical protein SAMN05660916_02404 [Arthrobacter sp. 31Cvi3.1E]